MKRSLITAVLLSTLFATGNSQQKQGTPSIDLNERYKPLKWRCIGPFRGGRSVAGCGVPGDPATYYSGITGGGLWKTSDMGISWNNVSDGFFKTGSVGAVTVASSDANVVYVGMGEHAVRGVMTHHGDGVYKSTDAGKTWKHCGLEQTQHIARIVVHPNNPDLVYVAAQGALYSPSAQRGIYKSTDGGKTWKNVLFVNEKTGCAELSIDPNNPRMLYAAMWEHGRLPWQVISGGPGSGLYKSSDGGDTWVKLTEGLPKDMGKMAIAVSPANSEKVYALIESNWDKEEGGLYVSNNAGDSWSQVTKDHRLIQRSWYYIEVFPDPQQENTVYVMSAPAMRSNDGGNTWEDVSATHGDYHNLWINPKNSNNMIISDDGGSAITFNRGKSWSEQNLPTGQFYRVAADNLFPYNIYGGQQDNSSVKIASRNISGGSITTRNWTSSAGGESAFLGFNPDDPRFVMGGSYQGSIELLDNKAKASTNVMAAPIQYLGRDAKDMKYRYNWNAPIVCNKFDPAVFYHGAQHVLQSSDNGKSWKEISPDLTRNEKNKQGRPGVPYTNEAVGAENYGTLSYILPSPLEREVIYTGSDDGLIHVTMNNGKDWQNITPAGLQECLINVLEVSPFDKATIYAATTRYKFNDHTPGLYKSTNYGKTWTKINNGLPAGTITRVIREDNVVKDLLYAGTETGIYLSFNGGAQWTPLQLNFPVTPVTDLLVHKNNLIAATSGRAYWILDDLHVLRNYSGDTTKTLLLSPAPAYLTNSSSELDESNSDFTGIAASAGVNPASGMVLYYNLPQLPDTAVLQLTITDSEGKTIRTLSSKADSTYIKYDGGPGSEPLLSKSKGLNRFVWNMRTATMPGVPYAYIEASYRGHKVPPGKYQFTLKAGNQIVNTGGEILANPLYDISPAEYREYHETMSDMEKRLTTMHQTINRLNGHNEKIKDLLGKLPSEDKYASIRRTGKELTQRITAWDEEMVQRKSKAYDDVENFPNKFSSDYLFLINQTESEIPRVTQGSKELQKEMNGRWSQFEERARQLLNTDIPAFNKLCWDAGIGAVWGR